jgi:parvulin-like peptidyl-prolyl isomerase
MQCRITLSRLTVALAVTATLIAITGCESPRQPAEKPKQESPATEAKATPAAPAEIAASKADTKAVAEPDEIKKPEVQESPKPESAEPASKDLAVVKGKPVTEDDLTSFAALLEAIEGRFNADASPKDVLEDLVLQKTIGDAFTTLPLEDAQHAALPAKYKNVGQRQYLRIQLRDELEKTTELSRKELEEWTERNGQRFTSPERVHAYHIFMQVSKDDPSSSPEVVRERMAKVKQEADSGTSFSELAGKYSEAASSKAGGEIGWITWRMPIGPESKPMNPVLEKAFFSLPTGRASDVLQTSHGLHLVYAADHSTTFTPTVDDLVSSQILPRAALVEAVTAKYRERAVESAKKHNGKVVFDSSTTEPLTTTTAAVQFAGRQWTIHDMELLYGQRFTAAYRRAQGTPEMLQNLMQQVLDDEAVIQSAIDDKLDEKPGVAETLGMIAQREFANKGIETIIAESYPATEEQARALYEKSIDDLRVPEGSGHIITLKVEGGVEGAAREEARTKTREKAEAIRKQIEEGADIAKLAVEVSKDDLASSGGLVERAPFVALSSGTARIFGAIAGGLKAGEVSDVRDFSDSFVIVKLNQRWPGEPRPFEEVKPRLMRRVQSENEKRARKAILDEIEARGLVKWMPAAKKYGITPTDTTK